MLESNPEYFRDAPQVKRVRFRVVPDGVVRALELRKGSADLEVSSLSPDIIPVLARQLDLAISDHPGTNLSYLGFNLEDPVLSDRELRQTLAFATDREALIRYLLGGEAKLAAGVLPPNHWAAEPNVTQYPYDPARAERLLETAGFGRKQDGVRVRLTLKCSTEEQARLIGAALQEQWWRVGVQLEVRPLELATSPMSLKGIFRSPTSGGSAPTPIRTFLSMPSRRSAFRPTAPIADTIATRTSTRQRTIFAWK